jgi:hypothetical protein
MRKKFATEEERDKRLAVCEGCPFYRVATIEVLNKCNACGCFIFAKSWLAGAECPKGLWGVVK